MFLDMYVPRGCFAWEMTFRLLKGLNCFPYVEGNIQGRSYWGCLMSSLFKATPPLDQVIPERFDDPLFSENFEVTTICRISCVSDLCKLVPETMAHAKSMLVEVPRILKSIVSKMPESVWLLKGSRHIYVWYM